jgi:ABC-2 type transport system permease protein
MSVLRPGGTRGALAAEWRKVRRQRFPFLAIGLAVVAILARALVGIEPDTLSNFNGYFVSMAAAKTGFIVASFLVLIFASTSLAGEATHGTLKLVLVRPVSRTSFLLAKIVMLLAFVLTLTVAIGATGWLLGLGKGYGDLVEQDLMGNAYTSAISETLGWRPLIAVGLALPSLIATAALGLLVSTLTDSASTAATTAFLVYLPLTAAAEVFLTNEQQLYLFTHHITRAVDRASELALAQSVRWDVSIVTAGLIVPLVTAALLFAAALLVFRRRNIAL